MDNYKDIAAKENKLNEKKILVDDTIQVGKLSKYDLFSRDMKNHDELIQELIKGKNLSPDVMDALLEAQGLSNHLKALDEGLYKAINL